VTGSTCQRAPRWRHRRAREKGLVGSALQHNSGLNDRGADADGKCGCGTQGTAAILDLRQLFNDVRLQGVAFGKRCNMTRDLRRFFVVTHVYLRAERAHGCCCFREASRHRSCVVSYIRDADLDVQDVRCGCNHPFHGRLGRR
jgi:hypothetical protein